MTDQPADFLARAQEGMGSRFQSQASIDESNTRREKEWKEAYARCVSLFRALGYYHSQLARKIEMSFRREADNFQIRSRTTQSH